MPRPFRLTAPRILESDRQGQIVDWLRAEMTRKRIAWFCRVNGGSVKTRTCFIRFYQLYTPALAGTNKGYGDLHGMIAGGRYFVLEVKQPGEKATEEQAAFLATVQAGGGIAAVVTGWEQANEALFGGGNE